MSGTIVALSGGVGGAKLVLGLSKILKPTELFVVANTGDDFEHLGYYICPDIDTLIYTLGGVSNTELGWGRANETWQFMRGRAAIGAWTRHESKRQLVLAFDSRLSLSVWSTLATPGQLSVVTVTAM